MSGGNLWGRKLKWRIGLGFSLTGLGLFMLLTSFPQYAIGFSVLATLALAFAAFLTIKSADEREKRHRERDFKRRVLDDIQDWAKQGIKSLANMLPHAGGPDWTVEIYPQLKSLTAQNKWMMDASRIFAEDDKKALLKKVDKAAEELKQLCEVLEGKFPAGNIIQRRNQCLKSFTEVLERIADVKVKLKL